MRKFKYLLLLSLVAVIACGIFVGCGGDLSTGSVNRKEHPYCVTYCGNGGLIDGKSERYYYYKDGDHSLQPGTYEYLPLPIRTGYTFVGWAMGEIESGEDSEAPLLLDTALYGNDGGVYMTKDGAVAPNGLSFYNGEYEHKFYSYDRSNMWSFSGTAIKENIVLVAVWDDVNKFIIAKREGDGWEDLSAITDDPYFSTESELYEKYADRLHETSSDGKTLLSSTVKETYAKEFPGRTAISFYLDPNNKNRELGESATISNRITPIYYDDIEGDYDVVRESAQLVNALNNNRNVYLVGDVKMNSRNAFVTVEHYGGTADSPVLFEGNGHTISGVRVQVQQTVCPIGKENVYSALFGELEYVEMNDVTIRLDVEFTIAIDPSAASVSQGTSRDALCYISPFAERMSNVKLGGGKGVNIIAQYIELRTQMRLDEPIQDANGEWQYFVDNDYEVEVERRTWQAATSIGTGNVIGSNCSISFDESL